MERRARAKRRNTIVGAAGGTAVVIAVLLILTFTVFTGGSSSKASVKTSTTPTASPTPTFTAPPATCKTFTPNPLAAGVPKVPTVSGHLHNRLVMKDVKVGTGRAAKNGDTVTVKYVGYSCDTGKSFDASYTDGAKNKEFSFKLGAGSVIKGWDQGVVGMKAGGVRELVIPNSLAYGPSGQGADIPPYDTLVFLITMDKV